MQKVLFWIAINGEDIYDLNSEEIVGTFYEKDLQKTNQKEFRIEKEIKRKGDKLYPKWKGYDNSFKLWIDKKILLYKNYLFFNLWS